VGNRDRRALARDVDEEPARGHPRELEHADGNGVQTVEIVQEPTIEPGSIERGLQGGQ
jgi:hypothetical protein